VVSIALLPFRPPATMLQLLNSVATHYGRLARQDSRKGGLYYGEQLIPPDAFAVEAEQVFHDLVRRCSQHAYLMRVQISGHPLLPQSLVAALGATISPPIRGEASHIETQRSGSTYEIRWAQGTHWDQVTQWNLQTIDLRLIEGDPAIWHRPDPPNPMLSCLAIVGDARDASCAFRLPIAVDGAVPGFRVRRGQFGHAEVFAADGPAVSLGVLSGTESPLCLSIDSLTKHALFAGSTGSGKTTLVMELLRQLWVDHNVPFLVIEPVNSDANDYRKCLAEPSFETLEVITVAEPVNR
jgi:Cdc6-like AAA superfamily ATPase